jgi:hypothetical protein
MPTTKTVTYTLYKFDELSEEAQEKALNDHWNLNVDHDWWEYIYEDAAMVGLKIEEFDIGYRNSIKGTLTQNFLESCKLVRVNHGAHCDTFKTAKTYLAEYIKEFKKWMKKEKDTMESESDGSCDHWKTKDWLAEFKYVEESDEVEKNYNRALLEDYLSSLRSEYDYQTSREQIIESIRANDYDFNEKGLLL